MLESILYKCLIYLNINLLIIHFSTELNLFGKGLNVGFYLVWSIWASMALGLRACSCTARMGDSVLQCTLENVI